MCLLAKEVPHEDYKRDPVSMKDQDSLWIINPLNWYYKFSKSIVISVFYPFLLLLLSTQSLRRLCQTSRHLTLPLQPGRTDSVHVRPTPCLRGLNNLSNLRLYDRPTILPPNVVVRSHIRSHRKSGETQSYYVLFYRQSQSTPTERLELRTRGET